MKDDRVAGSGLQASGVVTDVDRPATDECRRTKHDREDEQHQRARFGHGGLWDGKMMARPYPLPPLRS